MLLFLSFIFARSDTPPVRNRDGGTGSIQPPVVGANSPSGSTDQAISPVGTQAGHHQPFLGGRGNYTSFPDNGSRMVSHPQQRVNSAGELRGFGHQDEAPQGGQQSQIWGAPHPHFDRNGRADLAPLENNPHLQHHHAHPSRYTLHTHKQENGRERERGGDSKKTETSPPLPQPCLSSSCSSSSSSSSAREDGSGKQSHHHHPPRQHEHDTGPRGVGGRKQDKTGNTYPHTQSSQHSVQQHHSKSISRGREQKTETQWGPRPGSSGGHNRKGGSGMGGNTGGEDLTSQTDKAAVQSGGGNPNKRVGPIKRPVLKEMKREVGEGEGGEKNAVGSAKDKDQDANQASAKQASVSSSQTSSGPSGKDETAPPGKARNGGKDRGTGGGMNKASKEGENSVQATGSLAPPSRRDREHSYETGGATYHAGSSRGNRASRGRGEFYGRGRGYRGSYAGSARGRAGGRSSRDYRSAANSGYQHGSSNQDHKREGSSGRHGQGGSQPNPGRARNHSETRSEGSEYEEVPKRRRQRGSETGSESAASDLAHSDKEDRKPSTKKGTGGENLSMGNASSSAPPRNTQTRVFTPRGVPSRRGRGGGSAGGGVYRNSGSGGGMSGGHRSGPGSSSQSVSAKSNVSARKQHAHPQPSLIKETSHGSNGEKKEKAIEQGQSQNQGVNSSLISGPTVPTTAQLGTENGSVAQTLSNTNSISSGSKPVPLPNTDGRNILHRGFERPPRRRRHGRSQHQQDKPPRFRRLKQERENAARINGSSGIIEAVGGQQQQSASPSQNSVQDGTPNVSTTTGVANTNHNISTTNNNNSSYLGGGSLNLNSHHHHHHPYHGNSGLPHSQHHHNHNQTGGAKSPDVSNQNSDQANEEWETASESSDFAEFRDREGGGGGGKSYSSYHHHHPSGRGGGGVDREITTKESAANKRSFSSQRPGMERQNRRVSTGGSGGRGSRGPPASGGPGGVSGNGGANRGERRGNWPSPKNRK